MQQRAGGTPEIISAQIADRINIAVLQKGEHPLEALLSRFGNLAFFFQVNRAVELLESLDFSVTPLPNAR
jgi:hypothetical protein